MMGGLQHRATDFGNLALRAALERCKCRGVSYAAVFIDVVAAFCNLRRKYLVPGTDTLTEAGRALLDTAVSRLGAAVHLAAAIAAAYHTTWFTIQHDGTVSLFLQGVLPGDPEADLLFVVIILEALDEVHDKLVLAGHVQPHGPAP